MIRLTKYRPELNQARFYALSIQPDFFDGVQLVREWGRIGQGSTLRLDCFEDETAARAALERLLTAKLRKGYSLADEPSPQG